MININIDKAKQIANEIRREKRAQEFAPLDIKVTIPSESEKAEEARRAIRQKYAEMQAAINAAQSADELREIISG